MELIEGIQRKYKNGNLSTKLIFINIVVFILFSFFRWIFTDFSLIEYLGLNSSLSILITKPWTIFTYMFLHLRPMHLLFNMLMLWVVGDFFYKYFGDKAFAQFYFLGGIFGGLFYLLMVFFSSQHSILMGASAAIYSVLFAMVAYQPELQVRLLFISQPIKLLHVAIGFIVLGFIVNAENLGGNISHVGGAIFGYLYMKYFEKGKSLTSIIDSFADIFKTKKKSHLRAEKSNKPPKNDFDYADWKKQKDEKTNQILEKISRSGYNSLTQEEKAFLFSQKGSQK